MKQLDIQVHGIRVDVPGRDRPLFSLRSWKVPFGSRILIHGPSGKGKTTLLHLLAGQFPPDAGDITVGGASLPGMEADARSAFRRAHYGIIFQRLNLFPHLDAPENCLLGARPSSANEDAVRKGREALARMGMDPLSRQRCGTMSPGEQQRVAVARVLAAEPDIILADEPTSSLDHDNAEKVMGALCGVSAGRTLIVVSHDRRIHGFFPTVLDFPALADA